MRCVLCVVSVQLYDTALICNTSSCALYASVTSIIARNPVMYAHPVSRGNHFGDNNTPQDNFSSNGQETTPCCLSVANNN